VLQIFPFLTWLAAITSGVLLAALWNLGELRRYSLAALLGWFLLAGYCQFLAGSPVVAALGLLLQTILAICLSLRWKLGVRS
jgi:hypothetical protein